MNQQDQEFLDRLRATFRIEAAEHLQTISDGLLALEKEPETAQAAQLIETVYRAAHSLKGAARAVSLGGIEEVCRSLESVLAALKRQTLTFTPELINLLYQTVDLLAEQTEGSGAKHDSGTPPGGAAIIEQLEAAARNERPPAPPETVVSEPELAAPLVGDETGAPPEPASDKPARAETVRISVARLDALLLEAEEMLSVKQATAQLSSELRELRDLTVEWERRWARVQPVARQAEQRSNGKKPASKLDSARLPEFLDWNQSFFRSLQERLTRLSLAAEQERRVTANLVDNLLADVKQAVMMPFAALLEGFPKLARDLARDQGRAVELLIEGGELEIDRRVLDELKDPLIHLVRNSVDHGLEDPPERLRQGKPERGTIVISAAQQGSSRIEITVSDDGAGIDLERVSAAAVRTGLLTPAQAAVLSDEQALSLIFQSGFSTSPVITDISGRGLGLAILRERVERLGGSVTVVSTPHSGTIFRLRLPLTLATFRGVLVETAGQVFVAPVAVVERVLRVRKSEIRTVEGKETIQFAGQAVALVRLDETLELARSETDDQTAYFHCLIINAAGNRIAFIVNAILGEQEVIVKSPGTQLARVRNIAGATVLGSGRIALILNAADLVKSAVRLSGQAAPVVSRHEAERKRRTVLVAEDSITSRTLLRNVLESAGYQVRTATDGLDAWAALKTESFDLLVSDVEMPRLDGFALTERVRGDEQLRELPVVLVTALASAEDRARGVDAGANAYVVKSSFDQGSLLEVIRRLIG